MVRGPVLIFNAVLAIAGVAILGFGGNDSFRYFGAFLVVGGANSNVPASLTYQANNIEVNGNGHSVLPQSWAWVELEASLVHWYSGATMLRNIFLDWLLASLRPL
jgi:hypothetical protein